MQSQAGRSVNKTSWQNDAETHTDAEARHDVRVQVLDARLDAIVTLGTATSLELDLAQLYFQVVVHKHDLLRF